MASPQSVRAWPMLDQYDQALSNAFVTVYDADIKTSKLPADSRTQRLNGQSNKYVSVYKMDNWVVKCFFTNAITTSMLITPPPDIRERYQAINDYIYMHRQQLPFLVPHLWIERAIKISGQDWPFVKSSFIQAPTLGMFLADHCQESLAVAALAKQWLAIISNFESLNMAHGDLDITNVLVVGTYPHISLRLVDFDSMYVPSLQGRAMFEQGHEHFQAPSQLQIRHFNSEMDRFSVLVIYLSLIALAEDWRLWDRCKANEETKLLLGFDDFRDLSNSSAYSLLRAKQDNQALQLCLDELASSIYDVRVPQPLSQVLSLTRRKKVPTATLSLQPPPTYVAPTIPIPVQFLTSTSPSGTAVPPPPAHPPIGIPIPTSYLQSPTSSPVDQPSRPIFSTPAPSPPVPSRLPIHPSAWWLLGFAILSTLLALGSSSAGGAAVAFWLILAVILLISMFAVIRRSRL